MAEFAPMPETPSTRPSEAARPGDAETVEGPTEAAKPTPGPASAPTPGTGADETAAAPPPKEIGGRDGPEPVRYGDWEKNGRCIDF
ncbi:MAG TPA: DUF1674 domain-containing protein [Gammaproteobacteria bacterium]|nr:DUF1674 domain-containing protein [Gammaproteobacteria bacterium]